MVNNYYKIVTKGGYISDKKFQNDYKNVCCYNIPPTPNKKSSPTIIKKSQNINNFILHFNIKIYYNIDKILHFLYKK